ncbi:winged helix-turn-helix transcriptional regulator [bacterium]|nr:winged helix-turn-helix transcriptional regulator [bacterium]
MEQQIRKQAEYFKALAHPTRIKIIRKLLFQDQCVGNIEESLNVPQANVSQHLHILRTCGIVDYRMDGKRRCYFLVQPKQIKKIFECINLRRFQ